MKQVGFSIGPTKSEALPATKGPTFWANYFPTQEVSGGVFAKGICPLEYDPREVLLPGSKQTVWLTVAQVKWEVSDTLQPFSRPKVIT